MVKKKFFRKIFTASLCVALCSASLAGCGSPGRTASMKDLDAAENVGIATNGGSNQYNGGAVAEGAMMDVAGGAAINGIAEDGCVVDSGYVPGEEPDWNTEEYSDVREQPFYSVKASPFSTFAADVDTASYANLRRMILSEGRGPSDIPSGAVRIEEMLNYFRYDSYRLPEDGEPFGVSYKFGACPWNDEAVLLRIGLRAEDIDFSKVKDSNLVFLIDVSGSMDEADKLPLLKYAFGQLVENLGEKDRVSIVTYAGEDAVVLEGSRGDKKAEILTAIEQLEAGGGTNGSAGIETAYKIAEKYFIQGGINRVILATDGDLNIGQTSESDLSKLVKEKKKSGVFLSVLGFGTGNISDTRMETLADDGDGNYGYIDSRTEAKKIMSAEMGATFNVVAKDVKLQAEFNPYYVKGYRLIGYDNRVMAAEDFADDTKDGGEIGAGHEVTVLYEIIPKESAYEIPEVASKYGNEAQGVDNGEMLTLRIRYKEPDGSKSKELEYPVGDVQTLEYNEAVERDFAFAASVAQFGLILKDSEYKGESSCDKILQACGLFGDESDELRQEFLKMVRQYGGIPDSVQFKGGTGSPSGEVPIGEVPDQESDDMAKVDNAMLQAARSWAKNPDMTMDEKKSFADGILFGLEHEGLVADVAYDEAACAFSFKYKNGAIGGWKLK